MGVYVVGNEYVAEDMRAIEVARELEGTVEGLSFVFVRPNEDVPFADKRRVVILDDNDLIHESPLLAYLSPGRYARREQQLVPVPDQLYALGSDGGDDARRTRLSPRTGAGAGRVPGTSRARRVPSAEPASQDEVLGALSGLGYRAWRVPGAEAAAISTRGPNGADAARRRNSFSETATPSGRSGRWRRCRLRSRTASSRAPASTT